MLLILMQTRLNEHGNSVSRRFDCSGLQLHSLCNVEGDWDHRYVAIVLAREFTLGAPREIEALCHTLDSFLIHTQPKQHVLLQQSASAHS